MQYFCLYGSSNIKTSSVTFVLLWKPWLTCVHTCCCSTLLCVCVASTRCFVFAACDCVWHWCLILNAWYMMLILMYCSQQYVTWMFKQKCKCWRFHLNANSSTFLNSVIVKKVCQNYKYCYKTIGIYSNYF